MEVLQSNNNLTRFTYDDSNQTSVVIEVLNNTTFKSTYTYDSDQKLTELQDALNYKVGYGYDGFGRLSSKTFKTSLGSALYTTSYTYTGYTEDNVNYTSAQLASITNGSSTISYTYDANGNILTISEGATLKASYTYDMMNQLIREDSAYSGKSIDYTYDIGGNLTSKTIYTFTGGVRGAQEDSIVYLYENDWKDQLSSYDGQPITYDAIGNPLSYRNGLSFTWANGRELAGVTNNGVTGTFTYNDSGIRTSKTYNGVTTSYLLNGSSIVRQTQGESTLDFFYDENGSLYGFQKGTSTYYYLRNGQNDIVGILDSSGTQVVSYTYDAWGNQLSVTGSLSTTIGVENPFRYRGYYFDTETGLYYLNSRYYDSVTGRFINADGLISASSTLLGTNMYAYCESNPVLRLDIGGGFWESIFDVLSLGASIIEVALNPADPWAWAGLVGDTVDLIPFVTGVGEVTRAVKITTEVVDQSDNVLDAAKVLRKSAEASTGSYEVLYKSGSRYVGKGGFDRAIRSAAEKATKYTDEVVSISWKSAPNDAAAFIDEYYMQLRNVNKEFKSYNKMWSPGKRLLGQ